eukprot:TRINITY_DN1008_c0_g1_i1.p1 TRINITY_DN1008_c0_g1~~TRINITY_DN1008_c0_g1_i1.p1  ORF type:complete len:1151 (+),score=416.49 TRINITY_DN1008_c0_g1_i1:86-3538(+)
MEKANQLLDGLSDERVRWEAQKREFSDRVQLLVGDSFLAAAFITYTGTFNQEMRDKLEKKITKEAFHRLPCSPGFKLADFLSSPAQVGEWKLQSLPNDNLSIQNAIIIDNQDMWPFFIDPQGQALSWILKREEGNNIHVTNQNEKSFERTIEDCLSFGYPLVITDFSNDYDPMLEPILKRRTFRQGKGKAVLLNGHDVTWNEGFQLILVTNDPNPQIIPAMSSKVMSIDFSVTMTGLEEQLLSRVVMKEKSELEDQRITLMEEINNDTRQISELEDELLACLSTTKKLLDDTALIDVLSKTKRTVSELKNKLVYSNETEKQLREAREEYRPVATRGSVLYFAMKELSLVNVMYQNSLDMFLGLFDRSLHDSERSPVPLTRIHNIINHLTRLTYRTVARGLFGQDKILFLLMIVLKIEISLGRMTREQFNAFIRGANVADMRAMKNKPIGFLPDRVFMSLAYLSKLEEFNGLLESVANTDHRWQHWFEHETPETISLCGPFSDDQRYGPLHKLMIVRCLREDRTMAAVSLFVAEMMGKEYLEDLPVDLEALVEQEASPRIPIVYLLSPGSDPLAMVTPVAKTKKIELKTVSMGDGQEGEALRLIREGMIDGNWVMLHNCHLGVSMLRDAFLILKNTEEDEVAPTFRLFLSSEPTQEFPIPLLHQSLKLTAEAPEGLRSGLQRSFGWLTDTVMQFNSSSDEWKPTVYALCFLHSVAQERRKFGSLGWNVPYEFNDSDLAASIDFLQTVDFQDSDKIPWATIRNMISDVLYGGRITDPYDRRLFSAYVDLWITSRSAEKSFSFGPGYKSMIGSNVNEYRQLIESSLPMTDSTELFGLNSNAEVTYNIKQTQRILSTIQSVQPKENVGSSELTREDAVLHMLDELEKKLPKEMSRELIRDKIKRGGGFGLPSNVFLSQEAEQMSNLLANVKKAINTLRLSINGTISMSDMTIQMMNDLFDNKLPEEWQKLSWPSSSLQSWMTELGQRYEQLHSWLYSGRGKVVGLNLMFNPIGFLTAVKQEICKSQRNTALDTMVLTAEVIDKAPEQVKDTPSEGVYVCGLTLEGAAWEKGSSREGSSSGHLVDAQSKQLTVNLPVVYLSAVSEKEYRADNRSYRAPVYMTSDRGEVVFEIDLGTTEHPVKWVLRGCACWLNQV